MYMGAVVDHVGEKGRTGENSALMGVACSKECRYFYHLSYVQGSGTMCKGLVPDYSHRYTNMHGVQDCTRVKQLGNFPSGLIGLCPLYKSYHRLQKMFLFRHTTSQPGME